MIRTVVVFESESARSNISALLEKNGITVRYCCRTGLEALRGIKKMGGGVVICGFKFPDMSAERLAYELRNIAYFLVVAKPPMLNLLENEDLFRLPTPIKTGELIGSVNMLVQLDQRRSRSQLPKRSSEEDEAIRQAKELIMEKQGMTEPQAHQFIQRMSMDTSSKMVEVARLILSSLD
jgi:AmiR/NasT family two-component response regulator